MLRYAIIKVYCNAFNIKKYLGYKNLKSTNELRFYMILFAVTSLFWGCLSESLYGGYYNKKTFECSISNSIPNKLACPNFGKIPVKDVAKYPAGGDIYEKDYCVQGKVSLNRITENYITDVKTFNSEYLFDSFLMVYDSVCGGKPPFFGEIEFAKNIVSESKKEDRKNFTDTVRLRSGKILEGVKASVTKESVVVVDSNGNASVYRKSEVHSVDRK